MREILFKAKRTDNGEWGFGYYCHVGPTGHEKHYIIPVYASAFYGVEVDPSTVCQYTGLTDKNGVKIFEGDSVYIEDWECVSHVYWKSGAWMLKFADCDEYLDDVNSDCKVIGSIYAEEAPHEH